MTTVYEVNNVSKIYPQMSIPALNNISFSSNNNNAIGILGSNGAGKTTLFMASNALLSINSGDILINNYSVKKEPNKIKQCTGLFTDKLVLYPVLTVKEVIKYFLGIYGISSKKYNYWRDWGGVKEFENRQIKHLSTGMLKKVMLLISVISKPKVLFLDEPFSGLDPVAKSDFLLLLKSLKEEEKIKLIISSHDLTETQVIVNEVVIIEKGTVIESGEVNNLIKKYNGKKMISLYINRTPEIMDYIHKNNFEYKDSNDLIIMTFEADHLNHVLSELGDTDKFVDIVTKEVSLDILYNEVRKNAIHNITE
ncbi:MAG: ABC transporter ATP-binding protein [Ruminococcus sp.]|nr:ABC transporter ATP-binding protein [Ruminococcus sp.]